MQHSPTDQRSIIRQAVADKAVSVKTIEQINALAKSKNIALEYYYDTSDTASYGQYSNNTLKINLASKEGAYYTAVHEYAHHLEQYAPHLLTDYLSQVDKLIEMSPKFKAEAEQWREIYRNDPRTANMSDAELRNEIAFKITKQLIDNPSEFNAIVTQNMSIAQRIKLWLRNFLNRLTKTNMTAEQQAVRKALTALETAIKEGGKVEQLKPAAIKKATELKYGLEDSLGTLEGYSKLERSRILANKSNLIADTYAKIVDFIEGAQVSDANTNLYIGKIGQKLSAKINGAVGKNLRGYYIVLNSNNLKHIFKQHGDIKAEKNRGQIAVDTNNITNIIDTIITPDKIALGDKNTNDSYIVFEKHIDGKYSAVTLLSTQKTKLTLKTAWIKTKSGTLPPTTNDMVKTTVNPTRKGGRSTHSADTIIRNSQKKSQELSQNIHKEDRGRFIL